MTVGELKKYLNNFEPKMQVLVGSDEELNELYDGFEVALLSEEDKDFAVIYGTQLRE